MACPTIDSESQFRPLRLPAGPGISIAPAHHRREGIEARPALLLGLFGRHGVLKHAFEHFRHFIDIGVFDGNRSRQSISQGFGKFAGVEQFQHCFDIRNHVGRTGDKQCVRPDIGDDPQVL